MDFNRFNRLGLVVLLLGPVVLAVAALTSLIPLPRIAEHVVDLLVGIELVVFSFRSHQRDVLPKVWITITKLRGYPVGSVVWRDDTGHDF